MGWMRTPASMNLELRPNIMTAGAVIPSNEAS
jgi:hypothetical protein